MSDIATRNNPTGEDKQQKQPLGIYIHWGFCRRKCPYCDFMSKVMPTDIDFGLWLQAYKQSLDWYKDKASADNFFVSSVFFGGGTPSLLPAWFVQELLEYISNRYEIDNSAEISLEANPYLLSKKYLYELHKAGINRLSLGVQSFDEEELQFLGRLHSAKEAITAIENTASVFTNYSFDLIYALPKQPVNKWEKSLAFALDFRPYHLSLYQLTIEPPSFFYQQKVQPLADEEAIAMYSATLDMTEEAGLPAYEVSNHARKGYQSQHNLLYWHYKSYLGIGASAHSRISCFDTTLACKEVQTPVEWFKAKNKNQYTTQLTKAEIREEQILMGLRLREGIEATLLDKDKVQKLIQQGLVHKVGKNNIAPTRQGLFLLNQVIEELV